MSPRNPHHGKNSIVRDFARALLRMKGPLSTIEIKQEINEHTKHGTTGQEVGQVLGRDPMVRKVERQRICSPQGPGAGTYLVQVWTLKGVEG